MMRRSAGLMAASAVLAGAVVPVTAQEVDVLRLAPASAWVLDYAEDSCALRRAFGEEGQSVTLEMRQFAPNEGLQFSIFSEDIGTTNDWIRFGVEPDEWPTEDMHAYFVNYAETGKGVVFSGDLRRRVLWPTGDATERPWLETERAPREAEITGVTLAQGFNRPLTLATGALTTPMQAMRGCLDELLTHWGIDVEAHRTLTRTAEPTDMERLAERVSQLYPSQMIREGEVASVRIRVMVGRDGSPTGCSIQAALGQETFEQAACRQLMRYSRFLPALDEAGNPIASYWTVAVNYDLSG